MFTVNVEQYSLQDSRKNVHMWLFFMLVRFVEEKKRKTKFTAKAALIMGRHEPAHYMK